MAYNPKWNVLNRIIDGDTRIAVTDGGTSEAIVVIDSTQVADFQSGGLTLATGARVNEFSTDGTLVGDADTAIPTEQAVKTYVDNAISNLNPDKIWQDDSYVQVIDDGTNAGYVKMVADGVEVVNVSEAEQTFGNAADTHITILDGTATVPVGSVQAFAIDEDGISVELGATINEFSIDGTLAGDSDTVLPTEQAVKTYVDSQIGGQSHKIFQGDSYIQVIDDGTAQSYAEVVINGTQVHYWDDAASTIRMGKASGSGRIEVDDFQIENFIGATSLLDITATIQRMGNATDTYFQLQSASNLITGVAGTTTVISASDTTQTFGDVTDTFIQLLQGANQINASVGNTGVFLLDATTQRIGPSTASHLNINNSSNTVTIDANTTEVVNLTDTTQTIGVSGDASLVLNQTADTFTLNAGANTQISGGLTTMTLGVAGDTTIALDQTIDQVAITAGGESQLLIETSGVSVYEDLTVTGNLYVDGTTWVVHNQEVTTSDNIITLNYGEVGPGVTDGTAGIEIDRGTLTDYRFVFDEASDTFRVGEIGALQAVATREDSPESMTVPWWNGTAFQFQTAGSSSITVNTTADVITFNAASSEVATFNSSGLKFTLGSRINEFSIDGTLAGDSDSAAPTEKAVKTYVDAQIGGVSNVIFQGDSLVRVIDDGTAAGYIEVIADGVQVQYWDAQAASIRMGKASGAGRVTVTDTVVEAHIGATSLLSITDTGGSEYDVVLGSASGYIKNEGGDDSTWTIIADSANVGRFAGDSQRLGASTDYFGADNSTNTLNGVANSVEVINLTATSQTIGVSGDTNLALSQSSDSFAFTAGAVDVAIFNNISQRIGVTGDTNLLMSQTGNTMDMYVGGTQVIDLSADTQLFGVSGDTYVGLSQSTNTISMLANGSPAASWSATGMQLYGTGAIVNEFSIDGTLSGDSDSVIPTEKAVKTYVDAVDRSQIYADDSLVRVVDDGTAQAYAEVVINGTQVQYWDDAASSIRMGKASGAGRLVVTDAEITGHIAATEVLSLNASGLQLGGSGARANTISTDGGLGASDTTLITQQAAKTYVDAEIASLRNELDLINVQYVYSDTTAVSGDVLLVDTTAGDVNIELVEADDSKVVIKKVTGDANNVIVSTTPGTIDGKASVTIDTKYQAYHFVSDSVNFFIL